MFTLYRSRLKADSNTYHAAPEDNVVNFGEYVLRYRGTGFRYAGGTGVYLDGYMIPRRNLARQHWIKDQYELVAHLYSEYGAGLTEYIKGRFIAIVMKDDHIEIFLDQLGLYRAYYRNEGNDFIISDTVNGIREAIGEQEPDRVSVAMQALFHRVPGHYTVYNGIFKTTSADYFRISREGIIHNHYFNPLRLIDREISEGEIEIEDLAEVFQKNVSDLDSYLKPKRTLLTLTGGKDSRTILTALMGAGIKPVGITYGNNMSRDAVYAGMVADAAGIRHIIAVPPSDAQWHADGAKAIIGTGDPEISIHRNHRLYAFGMAAEETDFDTAFYTGYLGGEMLIGIYYDDLIFTGFLKQIWSGLPLRQLIPDRLGEYFILSDNQLIEKIVERTREIRCTDLSLPQKLREFHALFEIGLPHHIQDISLSSGFFRYSVPAFLDTEFLELLFRSRYNFRFRNASTVNPFKRHELFRVNMGIQHLLSPGLDSVPFGKRGYYNTSEYLRGPLAWSIVKGYRYLTDRRKYPPSFAYGTEYKEFLGGALAQACSDNSPAGDFYDTGAASASLAALKFPLSEKHLHKFSDIVTFKIGRAHV